MKHYSKLEKLFWLLGAGFLGIFFNIRQIGLQPDASLYAGLALRVYHTGENWLLHGWQHFERFYEHPPYFFQWGAFLFSIFGEHEWVARLMGSAPAYAGLIFLSLWLWHRFSWETAALCLLGLLTTGHYTKYVASSMMEGPLSLAAILAAISSFEIAWIRESRWWQRWWIWFSILSFSVMLATASKGIVGLGVVGAVCINLFLGAFIQARFRNFLAAFLRSSLLVLFAVFPFLLWAGKMFFSPEGLYWIEGYLINQVFRSATTDRGESFYQESSNLFFFLEVILRNLWPWWWTVPALWILAIQKRLHLAPFQFKWIVHSLVFFLCFLVPLSLVTYKLPHYLHPTYMVLAPCGAFWAYYILKKYEKLNWISVAAPRWGVLCLGFLIWIFQGERVSSTPNRGQEFYALSERIQKLPVSCKILVAKGSVDSFRMESFSAWYFRGRLWSFGSSSLPSAIAVPAGHVYWNPKESILWGRGECKI